MRDIAFFNDVGRSPDPVRSLTCSNFQRAQRRREVSRRRCVADKHIRSIDDVEIRMCSESALTMHVLQDPSIFHLHACHNEYLQCRRGCNRYERL